MNRAWLVTALLLMGGVASAGPVRAPAASAPIAAPPPDGSGAHNRPEAGDNRRSVGILEVRIEGLSDDVKQSFLRDLESSVDTKRYRLQSQVQMKSWMNQSTRWTEGCLVGRCLTELRKQAGAELVLLAALTGSGTSFGYVVTLVRTDTGHVVEQESDRCDVCTVSEVLRGATLAVVKLLNDVPDKLPDEAADEAAAVDRAVGSVKIELAARDRRTSRVGMAVTAVGVVAALGGLAAYFLQDQPTYALVTAVSGGAVTAAGIVVLTF